MLDGCVCGWASRFCRSNVSTGAPLAEAGEEEASGAEKPGGGEDVEGAAPGVNDLKELALGLKTNGLALALRPDMAAGGDESEVRLAQFSAWITNTQRLQHGSAGRRQQWGISSHSTHVSQMCLSQATEDGETLVALLAFLLLQLARPSVRKMKEVRWTAWLG